MKGILTGFLARWSQDDGAYFDSRLVALEKARSAMLDALGRDGADAAPRLARKLRSAMSAQSLWDARGEVAEVLGRLHGEASGVQRVRKISGCFVGLVPDGWLGAERSFGEPRAGWAR